MPKAFDALFAEIVPVRSASSALLSESSFHVFVGPSFLGVSEERVNTFVGKSQSRNSKCDLKFNIKLTNS